MESHVLALADNKRLQADVMTQYVMTAMVTPTSWVEIAKKLRGIFRIGTPGVEKESVSFGVAFT
jgi:hypothetical protein